MKFYEMEMQAHDFMTGWHTLQEWADYGFNNVRYKGSQYWDGLEMGQNKIDPSIANTLLEMEQYDFDDDGYIVIYVKDPVDENNLPF